MQLHLKDLFHSSIKDIGIYHIQNQVFVRESKEPTVFIKR